MNVPEYKYCPYCYKEIKYGAIKCKHCKAMLNDVAEEISTGTAESYKTDKPASLEITPRSAAKKGVGLIIIGVLLLIVGVLGFILGTMMFGDIGIAAMVGALSALLSGIGFLITHKKV